ncbi:MAG TPA: MotA/TolQ/ExbB proton channel family protein [Myxococcota bacterium]|nr:MotA/TolQ/ExbB proton channel family protein [Myxococcota bacterium]
MPELLREALRFPLEVMADLTAQGGPWVVWIFLCGLLMWTLVIERTWYFSRVLPGQTRATLAAWQARRDQRSWCARQIRRAMISRLHGAMSANLVLLRVLVPLSPLLGLIGTVSGMLSVFDSMALRGAADARAMASGVSEAMICTLTGLAVSISGLYPVHYFGARARVETELVADELVT